MQYNAVAMQNTASFCYEPNCIYSRISGFGENLADSIYIFYERRGSIRMWNSLYMVKKGGVSLKPIKTERSCRCLGKEQERMTAHPRESKQSQPEAGWDKESKERKSFSQHVQPFLV